MPLLSFDFFPSRPVQVEVSTAPLSSDAGLLPVRQLDEQIRLTEQFAAALEDRRHPTFTQQSLLSMVRQRIYGILADYEDQNDHDTLRSDPVFKLIADRLPGDPDLSSQPTLSRFENAVSIPDLYRLRICWSTSSSSRSTNRRGISRSIWTPSTTPPMATNNSLCSMDTMININIYRSSSRAPRTIWCSW